MPFNATEWQEVQGQIWSCELCRDHDRVACDIRQQTMPPTRIVKLMLIGVAPPHVREVTTKTVAHSATNNEDDNLRKIFIETVLGQPWKGLLERGIFFVHGVKCAVVPKDRHQNPPNDVIDTCAPRYLGRELNLAMPLRIVAFGKAPYRSLTSVPGIEIPPGLGISKRVSELVALTSGGVEIRGDRWVSRLHIAPFPLSGRTPHPGAIKVLQDAARLAAIV